MAYLNSAIKTVRVGIESSLNTTPSSWTYIEPQGDPLYPDVTHNKLEVTGQRDAGAIKARCVGTKAASVALKLLARGTGTGADDGVSAGSSELDPLLTCAMGDTPNHGEGADIVSATGSTITVGSGQGSNFAAGDAVMYYISASASHEVRYISSISGDTLTLTSAPSGTVSTSADLYASSTWAADQTDGDHSTLQLQVYDDDHWSKYLKGCSVKASLDVPTSGMATLDFNLTADDVSENSSATAPAFVAATTACAIPIQGVKVLLDGTLTESIDLKLDFGFEPAQRPAQSGEQGFAGHHYSWAGAKLTGKIYYDATMLTTMNSASTVEVEVQVGTSAMNAIAFRLPAVDFTAKHATANGEDVLEIEGIATGASAFLFSVFGA